MLALPLLDGMVPALTAQSRTAAAPKRRFGVVYVPHGAVMDNWTPAAIDADRLHAVSDSRVARAVPGSSAW